MDFKDIHIWFNIIQFFIFLISWFSYLLFAEMFLNFVSLMIIIFGSIFFGIVSMIYYIKKRYKLPYKILSAFNLFWIFYFPFLLILPTLIIIEGELGGRAILPVSGISFLIALYIHLRDRKIKGKK